MKIIEQSHEIISLPDNLLQVIEAAGRTCYKSEDEIGCTEDYEYTKKCHIWGEEGSKEDQRNSVRTGVCLPFCQHHSSYKFTQKILTRGHHAMIEFGDVIVRLVTNRGVTHELVRHRLCSFAQESTRYVNYKGGMEFIKPVWISDESLGTYTSIDDIDPILTPSDLEWRFIKNCISSELDYCWLLGHGWRPEQAREVLPNSLKTEIVVKGNIREWRHIFRLRTSKKAHPQIRALMMPLLTELQSTIPVVFDDI
jgi:thymidylate synthase (FAD)